MLRAMNEPWSIAGKSATIRPRRKDSLAGIASTRSRIAALDFEKHRQHTEHCAGVEVARKLQRKIVGISESQMAILVFIVFGFIVGLVARAIMPGRQKMGFLMTTIVGILGSIIGALCVLAAVRSPLSRSSGI